MKNNDTVKYRRNIPTMCTTDGQNCATYVNTIFNTVAKTINKNDGSRIIYPTQHLNITARLASLFFVTPALSQYLKL